LHQSFFIYTIRVTVSLESSDNNSVKLDLEVFVNILRLIIICVHFSTLNNRIFAILFFSIKM